ncbi:MAG: hypothetical protein H8E41_10150 [Desulfobulbaceae bacterium]|uniref:Uncharacterized protein n=1 Tax=Candidatus Desulfobia pelagia TaxID=2841692 RepID=A0A8J6ND68_9BACT|nr:hypothetical protein [Candidatus Desulfobia pelagia]
MTKKNKRTYWVAALSVVALFSGAQAFAGHPTGQSISLKGPDGTVVAIGGTTAFSFQQTCNGGCHVYEDIERHSFHSQLGANEFMGWDAYKYGNWNNIASVNIPWSQSPGHIGKW